MTAVLVIGALAIILLAVLVVGLLRSHAEIIRSLHQLGVNEEGERRAPHPTQPRPRLTDKAPADVVGQTLNGSAIHVGVSGSDTRTMLAFLSTGCSSCLGLWESLRNEDPVAGLANTRLVVITKGPEAESHSRLLELAPDGVTVIQTTEAWEEYGVPVTPYFIMVDGASGEIVGEGSAASWGQVRSLIGRALADRDLAETGDSEDAEFRADAELRRAGIRPGDPSLYPEDPPVGEDS